jgi:hypothetical protein
MATRPKKPGIAELQARTAPRLSLRDAGFERRAERLAHRLEFDPVEHVLEEARHLIRSASLARHREWSRAARVRRREGSAA